MKYFMVLTSFLVLSGCKTDAQKVKISAIYAEPKRITKEIPETGVAHAYTTHKEATERLDPKIFMLSKNAETLKFRIQGNISSAGHTINQVRKIRFEKGEQNGNTITLRYYTEVKRIPGKESANIRGYNYTKDEVYRIPADVKIIKIELYEEHINDSSDIKPKLIAQQTFNFFSKM